MFECCLENKQKFDNYIMMVKTDDEFKRKIEKKREKKTKEKREKLKQIKIKTNKIIQCNNLFNYQY